MTSRWRNTGAPFTTEDGETVGRGETFTSPAWKRDVVIRRRKLEPVAPDGSTDDEYDGTDDIPEPTSSLRRFDGVDFASDRAYEIARDAIPPLFADDFADREGTGEYGAFRADDVRDILEDRDG